MTAVESEGVAISWTEVGDPSGKPVLLVHGFASNGAQNWLAAGWDKALADASLRGIVVDLRGHGDSGRPVGAQHYRIPLFVADLVAVLDDLHIDSVDVIGYSFGARLAWELARAHPDRVGRLVLGGFDLSSPMHDFDIEAARSLVSRGTPVSHPLTAALMQMAMLVPGNDPERLLDVVEGLRQEPGAEGSTASDTSHPTLLVTGERDAVAIGSRAAAAALGADFVELPARSHASAVSARGFKDAATAWFAPHNDPIATRSTPEMMV